VSIVPRSAAQGARGILAPIARSLHRAGVSANAVTLAGLLLSLVAAWLVASGQPALALAVLIVGALADTLDGQIAKAAGGGTKLGAFLDSTFDRVSDAALAGAAVLYGALHADPYLLWFALVALISGSLVPYIRAKAESLGQTASVGLAPREARMVLLVLGLAAWAGFADSQFLVMAFAAIALLSTATVIQRIAHVVGALRNT
jgi:CDP-diacylglycerol---glycerol-3-phosphate 3-phosphatidyltransferase